MAAKQKINPCLWFDGNAEEAVRFYVSILKDSKFLQVSPTQHSAIASERSERRDPGAPGAPTCPSGSSSRATGSFVVAALLLRMTEGVAPRSLA